MRNYIYEVRTINPFTGDIDSKDYRAPSYDGAVKLARQEIAAARSLKQILAPVETTTQTKPKRTAAQAANHQAVKRAVYRYFSEVQAVTIVNDLNEIFEWSNKFKGSYMAVCPRDSILHYVNAQYPGMIR